MEALEAVFIDVSEGWGLSASERWKVRDGMPPDGGGGRRGAIGSVLERMALVTEIGLLLNDRMEPTEARARIRRGKGRSSAASPLEDMLGPTDMLRRVCAILAAVSTW